jgi:SAM-dependent methyltransferase
VNVRTVLRRGPTIARNLLRDLRYGRPLGGTIKSRYAAAGARDVGNADYGDLAILFAAAGVARGDVIVDVGCGKGRPINWLLSNHRENRIYGIELDPTVSAATARRLRRFENVTILTGDATALLPPEGTLFYLFNPFDEAVMRRFVAALADLPPAGRERRVIYYNYKHLELFRDDARFGVREIAGPTLRSALITVR